MFTLPLVVLIVLHGPVDPGVVIFGDSGPHRHSRNEKGQDDTDFSSNIRGLLVGPGFGLSPGSRAVADVNPDILAGVTYPAVLRSSHQFEHG